MDSEQENDKNELGMNRLKIVRKRENGGKDEFVYKKIPRHRGFFSQKDVREHTGCVNCIELSKDENLLISGGDDLRVIIWNFAEMMLQRAPQPRMVMKQQHKSNIFSAAFTNDTKSVYTGGNDGMIIMHDLNTGKKIMSCERDFFRPVFSISQNPFDNNLIGIASSALWTYDPRSDETALILRESDEGDISHEGPYYSVSFHPQTAYLLAASSASEGPLIYDIRNTEKPLMARREFGGISDTSHRSGLIEDTCAVYAEWSPSGENLAVLYSEHVPHFYNFADKTCHVLEQQDYECKQTFKSLTFIDERTIATGSDNFEIMWWEVPEPDFLEKPNQDQTFRKIEISMCSKYLQGHRSIPNQVRYSSNNHVLVSSGVENMVKLWSSYRLPWSYDRPFTRLKFGQYMGTRANQDAIEKRLAEELEEELGDELEGRAKWEDVFGGDPATAECRRTCEHFDRAGHRGHRAAHASIAHLFMDVFESIYEEPGYSHRELHGYYDEVPNDGDEDYPYGQWVGRVNNDNEVEREPQPDRDVDNLEEPIDNNLPENGTDSEEAGVPEAEQQVEDVTEEGNGEEAVEAENDEIPEQNDE
ncbi:unnamed protein product [Caenorhabditis bovis]|uniref:Uncharacterized protein n=1 Tax=Caenorhabditis bovis TaxID=2654633 RepID=A0A8S1EFL2_9PELO|nr:unnamed protein product [Caenorhabditis bovis]